MGHSAPYNKVNVWGTVLHVIRLMFGAQWKLILNNKYIMYIDVRLSEMFDKIFCPSFSGV